ncbi:hypothetical protein F0562_026032 [Nyssa sinensis]|uniref:Uncharacterized protein n=1 Tax=Nyssa sinensis TaxID=561372 RepID=A0A5J5BA48_9ASTE|nr:hypothetical protein F0562_026032 [Nyssa sinensis]
MLVQKCRKLELPLCVEMEQCYTSLEYLTITDSCDSLKALPLGFPKLLSLRIVACTNFETLSVPNEIQNLASLHISNCPNMVSFPRGGLPAPNLTWIWIENCMNLKLLPEGMHFQLPSLQYLSIDECPELESFPEGGLPSNLLRLSIKNCKKLMNRRMEWGLERLPNLKSFSIGAEIVQESFPEDMLLPSSLTSLSITSLSNLKSLNHKALQHLTSLQEMRISNCPNLQSLPEGLPTLDISDFINTIGAANTRFLESPRPILKLFVITELKICCASMSSCSSVVEVVQDQLPRSLTWDFHEGALNGALTIKCMSRLGECFSELNEVNAQWWSEMCSHTMDGPVLPEMDSHPSSGQRHVIEEQALMVAHKDNSGGSGVDRGASRGRGRGRGRSATHADTIDISLDWGDQQDTDSLDHNHNDQPTTPVAGDQIPNAFPGVDDAVAQQNSGKDSLEEANDPAQSQTSDLSERRIRHPPI